MKDYHATVVIRNGRLKSLIDETGLSLRKLAIAANTCPSMLGRILNFRESPVTGYEGSRWRACVVKLCEFLQVNPEDIFPEHIRHIVESNKRECYVDQQTLTSADASLMLTPSQEAVRSDAIDAVHEVIDEAPLTDRERFVLNARFFADDPELRTSLASIGDALEVSQERVRQIEAKAMRKLRHPLRSDKLYEALDAFSEIGGTEHGN